MFLQGVINKAKSSSSSSSASGSGSGSGSGSDRSITPTRHDSDKHAQAQAQAQAQDQDHHDPDELDHILPSYELDQSLYGITRNDYLSGNNNAISSPNYAQLDHEQEQVPSYESNSSRSSLLEDLENIPITSAESVLGNITSLPYIAPKQQIHLKIEIEKPKLQYRSGDYIKGFVTITNPTMTPIEFDMFIVSFEGRTLLARNSKLTQFEHRNFLHLLDLRACFTGMAMDLEYKETEVQSSPLPFTNKMPPKSSIKRKFVFQIPTSVSASNCDYYSSNALPPSLGSAHFIYPKDLNRKPDHASFRSQPNTLTDLKSSISYSINARVIVKQDHTRYISTHEEKFIQFMPNDLPKGDNSSGSAGGGLTPRQQLDFVLKEITADLRNRGGNEQQQEQQESSSSSDREKMVYNNSDRESSSTTRCSFSSSQSSDIFTMSSLSSGEEPIDDTNGLVKVLNLIGKNRCKKRAQHNDDGFIQLKVIPNTEPLQLSLSKHTSGCSVKIQMLYRPPSSSINSTLAIDPAKLFKPTITVLLRILKINTKSINAPFPIELDPCWFQSATNFKNHVLVPMKRALDNKTNVTLKKSNAEFLTTLTKKINSNNHYMPRAFDYTVHDNEATKTWQTGPLPSTFSKEFTIDFEGFNTTNFLKQYRLVPSFQSAHLARFYFIRLRFEFSEGNKQFHKLFSNQSAELTIDIPLDVLCG